MKNIWESIQSLVSKVACVPKTAMSNVWRWCSDIQWTSPRACMVYLVAIAGTSSLLMYYSFNMSDQQRSLSNNNEQAHRQVLEVLRDQLENRLTATEAYLQRLENKVSAVREQMEALGSNEATKPLEAHNVHNQDIDHVIKQEVSEQLGSLREEIKEEQQKQKRKVVLQRFLEQLSNEED